MLIYLYQKLIFFHFFLQPLFLYTGLFHLGFAYNPDIIDVLFIGGGGFSGPKRFLQDYSNVKIDVYDINGNKIDELINDIYSSGTYNVIWEANGFSSGTYLIVAEFNNQIQQQKIVLMK